MLEQYHLEVSRFTERSEYLEWLAQIAQSHNPSAIEIRNDDNFIKGCTSFMWVQAHTHDGCCYVLTDSSTLFGRGMCKILSDGVSGMPVEKVKALTYRDFSALLTGLPVKHQQGFQSALNKVKQNI